MRRFPIVLLTVAAVLAVSLTADAQEDPWFGRDKGLHFGVSATIAAGGYALAVPVTEERWHRAVFGGGLAITAGAAKEAYDATGAGSPSYRDFTWDVIGAATGVGLALLIDWAFSSESEKHGEPASSPHSPTPNQSRNAARHTATFGLVLK